MKFTSFFLFICISTSVAFAEGGNDLIRNPNTPAASSATGVNPFTAIGNGISKALDWLGSFAGKDIASDKTTQCLQNTPKVEADGSSISSSTFKKFVTTISTANKSCDSAGNLAQKACLESLSPHIATAGTVLGGLSSAVSMMNSAKDMCKETGDKLDLAKNALTIYNTACGGAKAYCDFSCQSVPKVAQKTLQSAISMCETNTKACEECRASAAGGSCDGMACSISKDCEMDLVNFKSYATKVTEGGSCFSQGCGSYALQLASAAAGVASMVQQSAAAKKCEKQLTAKTTDSNLDCSKSENANNATCICQKNPRQAGCQNANTGTSEPIEAVASAASRASENTPKVPVGMGTGGDSSGTGASSGGSAQPMAGGVDGNAGGSQGKLGASGAAAKGADASKGLNTNLYSGDVSGGSASGSGAGSGYGGNSTNAYSKYGITKDQARQLAGSNNFDVTGKSGQSNWDKVKNAYRMQGLIGK